MSLIDQSQLEDLQLSRELLLIRELESRGYVVRRKEDTCSFKWSRAINLGETVPDFIFRQEAMAQLRRQLTEDKVEFVDRSLDPTREFGRKVLIKSAEIRLLKPIAA